MNSELYTTLDRDKSEIRLLHLPPRRVAFNSTYSDNEIIECSLVSANLNDAHYEALSYEWGPPNPPGSSFKLQINGVTQEVRENLWRALFYLRRDGIRTLWVDALCINPKDVRERNHQVGQMVDVYQKANHVVIWLGREHEELEHLRRTRNQLLCSKLLQMEILIAFYH